MFTQTVMTLILAGRYRPGEILTGPEKAAKRLFEEHLRQGEELTFVEYIGHGESAGRMKKIFGREGRSIAPGITIQRKGIAPLVRLARAATPGIVHVLQFDRAAALYALGKRARGFRLVYTVHGVARHEEGEIPRSGSFGYRMKDRLAERLLFRRADRIVFVSEEARAVACRHYTVPPERSAVIPNGIDRAFATAGHHRRKEDAPLRIVLCGSPARPENRFDFLLDALQPVGKPLELYFLHDGTPSAPANPPAHIRIFELPRKPTEDLARFYADKDLFCSIKTYDTFSIASGEAMAAGLIPVLSRETGIARFVDSGRNGFVIDSSDRRGLTEIVAGLWNDPETAARISDAARRIAAELTWERCAGRYREIYNELRGAAA